MEKYDELCIQILANVGGKDNIVSVAHCVTRLRLILKDFGLVNKKKINTLKGVLGSQNQAGQYQIILGQEVPRICERFCELSGVNMGSPVDKKLDDRQPRKFSLKNLFGTIIDTISSCVFPILPIFMGAGLIKLIVNIVGPSLLNIVPADSDFITVLTVVGNAGFYFMPIFVAYTAAKKFRTSIPVAMFLGAVFVSPDLLAIVDSGTAMSVYGIPMTLVSYANQILPSILTVWILSYVYGFIDRHCPKSLKYALVPLTSVLIMTPIMLCLVGPLGTYTGIAIANASVWLSATIGPLAIGLIGGLWYILVGLGMDKALVPVVINQFATYGYDNLFWLSAIMATYSLMGVSIAYLFRCKKDDKSTAASAAITLVLGGVSEPTIFGCIFRFKKALASLFVGGFVGGVLASILKVQAYTIGTGNILFFTVCAAEGTSLVPAIICSVVSFVVAFGLAMFLGFNDPADKKTA